MTFGQVHLDWMERPLVFQELCHEGQNKILFWQFNLWERWKVRSNFQSDPSRSELSIEFLKKVKMPTSWGAGGNVIQSNGTAFILRFYKQTPLQCRRKANGLPVVLLYEQLWHHVH